MKRILFSLLVLFSLTAFAQGEWVRRGDCMPEGEADAAVAHGMKAPRRLRTPNTSWDASRTYHQLVILFSFSDNDFQSQDPHGDYFKMLNQEGYNQRNGAGCMAEYFREQSGGLFNLQFDVYGPYKVSSKAQPYTNPTESTRNYGRDQMIEATNQFLEEHPDVDFSQYDWNNDGYLNQVIYIAAGYCGNQSRESCYGYIWPNTSTFNTITTPDGKKISDYSCSCELWYNNSSCGIGTICHEFTHSLGLPDIYPTASTEGLPYSVVDEWDLMDGGNFTNFGWCPPNYSPLEKMLLGWLTPVELTDPTTVKKLKPVSDGGETYVIRNTDKEYYLLENRQWSRWDTGLPGQGLVIYHVNYDANAWLGNTPNNIVGAPRFDIVHADNMDYTEWNDFLKNSGAKSQYAESPRLHNLHLSGSPYPHTDGDNQVNNQLTDTSVPAAVMYNNNLDGEKLMSKPITNITMSEEGLITFDFMGGDDTTGIDDVNVNDNENEQWYDLQGRRVYSPSTLHPSPSTLLLVKEKNGTVRKIIRK